jgi:peptidoglycan/LPS O-acetylase OafA/YrhL
VSKTRPLRSVKDRLEKRTPDPILTEPALRRMALGGRRGLKVVTVFYGLTLVGFALTLGHLFDGRSFGIVQIGFMYLSWGLLGGALGGLAVPLARSAVSSIPVAALIFLPLGVAVMVMTEGWSFWTTSDLLFPPIASLLMGVLWGPLAWMRLHEDESRTRRPS